MFDNGTGQPHGGRKRGLGDSVTAQAQAAGTFDYRERNLRLMAEGSKVRWAKDVTGVWRIADVLEPVFGDMGPGLTRKVIGWQPARHARCNGDGTATIAFWSEQKRGWVFP